jgi:hypothetical protein
MALKLRPVFEGSYFVFVALLLVFFPIAIIYYIQHLALQESAF